VGEQRCPKCRPPVEWSVVARPLEPPAREIVPTFHSPYSHEPRVTKHATSRILTQMPPGPRDAEKAVPGGLRPRPVRSNAHIDFACAQSPPITTDKTELAR